ncbi:polysaccharide pyruvyl transferase family protein [Rossellomorea marisflavi]|uniref:polysaccharide pyruvyl transferase family protein n=1 Tax=Rossellomorea marisflavi TaxID=189381 RepID=UPI003D2EC437
MKVSLWGYYGFNYGDDIMLEIFMKIMEDNDIEVVLVDYHNAGLINKEWGPRVKVIDYRNLSKTSKVLTLMKLATNMKLNFWGGGTVFTDTDNDGNFKSFFPLRVLGGRIGYVSVGVGLINKRSRRIKTELLLRLSSVVSMRDKHSYIYSKRLNQKTVSSSDITYSYFRSFKNNQKKIKEQKYLLVSFRSLKGYFNQEEENAIVQDVIDLIPHVYSKYNLEKVIFLPLDKKDIEVNSLIASRTKQLIGENVEVSQESNVDIMTEIIRDSSIYISGRLHGSVASEYFLNKTITLSYSNKINFFYEQINHSFIDLLKENINFDKVDRILEEKRIENIEFSNNKADVNETVLLDYILKK